MGIDDKNLEINIQALQQTIRAKNIEILRLRGSIRYQLGEALVQAFRSPALFVRLPARLWRIAKRATATRTFFKVSGALECGLSAALPAHEAAYKYTDRAFARDLAREVVDFAGQGSEQRIRCLQTSDPDLQAYHERALEMATLVDKGVALVEASLKCPFIPRPKTVLYALHSSLPTSVNGYSIRSHSIIKGVSDHGWRVIPTVQEKTIVGVTKNSDRNFLVDGVSYLGLEDFKLPLSIEKTIFAYADAIESAAISTRPAILHAASNWTTGLATLIAARRLALPFVYEVRGFWEITRTSIEPDYANSIGYALQKKLETQVCCAADHLFTISSSMRDELIHRGIERDKITLVPNGISTKSDRPKKGSGMPNPMINGSGPVIGFVGSITPYEGLDKMIQAVYQLGKANIKARLLIVGDGPALAELQTLTKQLALSEAVVFTGKVTPEQARSAYDYIDIAAFIRPDTKIAQIVEPLKPLEAMASGTSVLLSPVAPLLSLAAGGDRAVIVADHSMKSLVASLKQMIENPDMRDQLGKSARIWVCKNRNWSFITQPVPMIYSALIGETSD